MHKQRSSFTGGTGFSTGAFNFNPQQFVDASNFGSTDGLNGMPFLGKTQPMPVQVLPKNIIRSLSHQRDNGDTPVCGSLVEAMSLGDRAKHLAANSIQGQGQTTNATKLNNFNGVYEGDFSPLLPTDDKSCQLNQQIKNDTTTKKSFSKKLNESVSDTDSEADFGTEEEPCWQRTYNFIKSSMPPQHQHRLDMALQHWSRQPICGYLLVMMQFVSVVLAGFAKTIQRVGITSQTRIHFWRYSFHLRSTVRNMLWRMANAKANDTMLFLIIVLVTPWLFVLCLFGFAVSFVVYLKTVLAETIHQMHMRLL